MEQYRADPCVYRKIVEGVHVDDILVSGEKEASEELHHTLNEKFPTEVRCGARLARGKCNNQTTSNDRYPHQVKRQTGVRFGCCGDVGQCSGVRDESHTALRDVVYHRGEYVALAEGAKEGMFVRSVMYFMQPNVYEITLMEDNEGAKAMAENPLSSGRSKHIGVRWHFIRELVEKKELKVVHVASEWHHADILTKALHVKLFKRHRKAILNLPAVE